MKWPAEKSSGLPFGMALADSHARAAARKAASSGVSSKSIELDYSTSSATVGALPGHVH